jgi:acyl carrier protein
MIETLKKLVAEVTETDTLIKDLSLEANLITDLGLDSLQFINLILALEDEYDFEIDFDELDLEEISIVGKLINYIEENRNDK